MKIYSALQIGEYHTNHCEDYLFIGDIGNHKILCAVMDGCTMATDSYFASSLVGKLLRKITVERSYKELYQSEIDVSLDKYLKSILKELFIELKSLKNQLMLDQKELLTTLLILLLDTKNNQGIVLAIGDGLVSINGEVTDFDQENKPDYLGFHLNEDFDDWYNEQEHKVLFDKIQDISIATDGIFTFIPVKKPSISDTIDPLDFFLVDKTNEEVEGMLNLRLKALEHSYGLKPTDDFAMIRIIA